MEGWKGGRMGVQSSNRPAFHPNIEADSQFQDNYGKFIFG